MIGKVFSQKRYYYQVCQDVAGTVGNPTFSKKQFLLVEDGELGMEYKKWIISI
jgi:hypothetical protein